MKKRDRLLGTSFQYELDASDILPPPQHGKEEEKINAALGLENALSFLGIVSERCRRERGP